MGPNRAAKIFAERCPNVDSYRVTLYGSLAATGEGHMTDKAIITVLEPLAKLELVWKPETFLPFHPNGMLFEGIKEGISSAWSSLTNWFKEKLSGLVDGVKDFFKIGSPSKLFADEVGRWIPVGIAQGINDGMGALDKAVQGMTAEVTQKGISTTVRGVMDYGSYDMSDGSTGAILALLAQYLPIIARGNNITLEGDAARLFRLIQREAMRNTQLVGDDAVLSGI